MSIATAIQNAKTKIAAAYTSCNNKGATMPALANQNLLNLAPTIDSIPVGGGGSDGYDVLFFDYDGNLAAHYSASTFSSLSALPEGPSHAGLTFQGWNWSLSNAKTYVANYGKLHIGAVYVTSDGKTRLYISIVDSARMDVPLYWQQTVSEGVVIDWGDGSATQSFTGSGYKNTTHTYAAVGDYVISFTVNSGSLGIGDGSSSCVFGPVGDNKPSHNTAYRNMLRRVELGSGITTIGYYAFSHCYSLLSVTIPNSITGIDQSFDACYSLVHITIPSGITNMTMNAFSYCYALASISLPKSTRSISSYAFSYCYSLKSVTLPDGLRDISDSVFHYCYSLLHVIIPSSVTTLGGAAFNYCYSLRQVDFYGSVTTINASAFYYCRSLASFTIPAGVTSISNSAFQYCYSLVSITVPSSVTSISSSFVASNFSMKALYMLPTTPPTLNGTNAFSNQPSDFVIYVPSSSVESYKAATNWSSYSSIIQAIP